LIVEVHGMTALMKVRKTIEREFSGLGARIKKAREANSRSLIQLCAEIDMTPANWYKIENEETKVLPLETLRKIEGVLKVDLGVDLDDEPSKS
jgi:transcriptional regulator with XRE-family HTH domain